MSLHRHLREQARREHGERLHRMAGGSAAEDAKSDRRIAKVVADREVKKGIREHDSQLHGPGKHTRLALRDGGFADGGRSAPRYDRGGRRMGGGRHGSHVSVTVMPGVHDRPMPVPVPAAGIGGGGLPPRPPMMPPGGGMGAVPPAVGAGMPPPGLARPPMGPAGIPPGMMMRKDGGSVVPPPIDMKAGAQSGEGRLEKTKAMRREKSAALTGPY